MNRRFRSASRSSPNRSEPFLKYLKPGALARIRDSRISARSNRVLSILQIRISPPASPSSTPSQPPVSLMDGFPCFSARAFGPRCPQRKKLVASRVVLFPSQAPSSPVLDSPEPIIDTFGSSDIAAH